MSKRTCFSTVTPLPADISRETVLSTLRNHFEMIDLNPLVIDRHKSKAPDYALEEELHAHWYAITDSIKYVPGMKGIATTYHGCFHDLADGIQTHVYAPAGLEIKGRWTLGGSLPGEPPQPVELGLDLPRVGLWLKEDVDMKCNILLTSFVKRTLKKSHSHLVGKLLEKAQGNGPAASKDHMQNTEPWQRRTDTASSANSSINPGPPPSRPDSVLVPNSFADMSTHTSPHGVADGPDPSMYQQRADPTMYAAYKPLPPHPQSTYENKREDHLRGMGYTLQAAQSAPAELPAPEKIRGYDPAELA